MDGVQFAAVVAVVAAFGAACMYVGWRVGCAELAWWKARADELNRYLRGLGR